MSAKLKKQDDEDQWWGWSLPLTRQIITSFDRLAVLLGPQDRTWPPSHPQKIAGEIRPRTKTLQHTLRSVTIFQGSEGQMQEIKALMLKLGDDIKPFLMEGTVKMVLNDTEEAGLGTGRGEIGSLGGGGAALRRWREGMHGAIRKWLIDQLIELEGKIGPGLVAIENILRPPRIIKLGGSPTVADERVKIEKWRIGLAIAYDGIVEALWDLWMEVVQTIKNVRTWLWRWR